MRLLIVAATEPEVSGISGFRPPAGGSISDLSMSLADHKTLKDKQAHSLLTTHHSLLTTGVGIAATAFALGRHLAVNQYDAAINLGIAGSFDRDIALGDVVQITQDCFAELGAEDDESFLPIEQLGYGESLFKPLKLPTLIEQKLLAFNLKKVNAITVNTVHGNEASIQKVVSRLNPQLESMEGAAFFYSCRQFNLPCVQIRAVSNYVEKRNRANWQIGPAIKNLNNFAAEFLTSIG